MDKAIFFDIDGTLLDTSSFAEVARKAAIDVMIENGLPSNKEETYNLLKEIISKKGSNYNKHFNVLTKEICGEENNLLVALGMVTYHNVKFALLRPFPETMNILIYLKNKGYKLGVISNGITIKQWEKLVRLDIHYFFEEVITSEEVGSEKPEKKIFEEALNRMNCKAENSIMVGNKSEIDIIGAVNAGMSAILVNSDDGHMITKKTLDNSNIEIIDNIGEIYQIL
ncbi:MAG: TIGR02253 family HAD-type hydrolase [Methanobrevibacter arboriphilus]|uniref:Glyceraldehyde 3-phosphate phosphatase n=1 Tax=Methanobrevibacter arboriphilus TaxID=39441 RepID=A0A843AHN8_METAZ|nr:TIGR02253 family HAD-type hydrolase [Methanobrevibacter arboriphilus]MBF4469261.1 TIGR02253 family HAD-type hydrolase [Methanobrevibacter arboriphilus]